MNYNYMKNKDYEAILTIYGLNKMKPKKIYDLKLWIRKVAMDIRKKENYSDVAHFKLMK